ncbi:succinylglutamate desuccinylase/aspartoacylase family protein [Halobacteria archaeon AArc-m2/3/4]|uniref:Succinylglutamate desuccinylase/aspartoacylase family protein n=1 Tax=Natronoglomus mannanivorans TaxID=2979990 RepID=A0ABT2QGW1_9EURY|nr:succinylglutamate desuccinylase/aspartoacylase family protein [Halobacteria archaeon AArc-m2/3/4]
MGRFTFHRRSFLAATASCAIAGVGLAQSNSEDVASRDSFVLLPGTDHETTVYETTGVADGPTVLVVGGIHGNEIAGYEAAAAVADWDIDAGTLVTIPEANAVAIEQGTRIDANGVDLNRQFPTSSEPETELARAIWEVVLEYDPDVVIDLHESIGIYDDDPVDGVGQAIFHSSNDEAGAAAVETVSYLNENYVEDPQLHFQTGYFTGPDKEPQGLLVHKVERDLGADAYLAETLSTNVDLETRIQWHTVIVRQLADALFVEGEAVPDDSEDDSEPEDDSADDEADDGAQEPDDSEDEPDDGDSEADDDADEDGSADSEDEDEDGEDDEDEDDEDDDADEDTPADESDAPVARIQTSPEDADQLELDVDQSIRLDAKSSSAPDAEIVSYEWTLGADGSIEESGPCLEVTLSACGEYPITLCVTDDQGRTASTEIVLSTI